MVKLSPTAKLHAPRQFSASVPFNAVAPATNSWSKAIIDVRSTAKVALAVCVNAPPVSDSVPTPNDPGDSVPLLVSTPSVCKVPLPFKVPALLKLPGNWMVPTCTSTVPLLTNANAVESLSTVLPLPPLLRSTPLLVDVLAKPPP